MKLRQYQRLSRLDKSNIDAVAAMVCEVFGFSTSKVNEMSAMKFGRCVARLESKQVLTVPFFKSGKFITDATRIDFGQFIEIAEWLKPKPEIVDVMEMVGASIMKDRSISHSVKVVQVLKMDASRVGYAVNLFIDSYNKLIEGYSWLFDGSNDDKPHAFMVKYGWIYSAKAVGEHLGYNLEQAFNVNVIEALNSLAYLKGKGIYEDYLSKKK